MDRTRLQRTKRALSAPVDCKREASVTIDVRWARAEDSALPFIADAIPPAVVEARIATRCIAVAELAGDPVGALQLEYLWGTRPYIAMVRVRPDQQRRGVGRSLLAFVEHALQSEGHSELLSSSQADEPEPQACASFSRSRNCDRACDASEGEPMTMLDE